MPLELTVANSSVLEVKAEVNCWWWGWVKASGLWVRIRTGIRGL